LLGKASDDEIDVTHSAACRPRDGGRVPEVLMLRVLALMS
jgi:hypothetical protein